jgi:ATP synthase in type III secretion protein N
MTAAPPDAPMLTRILPDLRLRLREAEPRPLKGRLTRVVGTVIHAIIAEARLGELCQLRDPRSGADLAAEVVGFDGETALLTPIGDMIGLSTRTEVVATGTVLQVPADDSLLGRVLDALGRALDGDAPIAAASRRPVYAVPPNPTQRDLIERPLPVGMRAIDGLLTCGEGQRIGIYGEPGAGKSTLLGRIVAGAEVDVAVIGLIGERGREVREFVDRQLGKRGRERAVVIAATSDRPAMERVKAAYVATTIAEGFRDQGKKVLLVVDSITRFARAQREIGLAAGEPPTRRGFPPSVFATLPQLLERSGPGADGSITAFYTVLVEGDGTLDPIAEETRAILDGHIILSAALARAEHYPAIDILASRSRVMDAVVSPDHRGRAARLRQLLARYAEIELLLRVGEYQRGTDRLADEAVAKIDAINGFLRQSAEATSWADLQERLRRLAA